METEDDGPSGTTQAHEDEGDSLRTGWYRTDELQINELQCQLDLEEAQREEMHLPVSDVGNGGVGMKDASEDAGVGIGLVRSDLPEKDKIWGEVGDGREIGNVEEEDPGDAGEKREVKVADLSDAGAVGTEASDVVGDCFNNQAREIQVLDDTKRKGGNVINDRVEDDIFAEVGAGDPSAGESSVSKQIGLVDEVTEEKDMYEAVTGAPPVEDDMFAVAGGENTFPGESSVSELLGSVHKVAEGKDLYEAMTGVPYMGDAKFALVAGGNAFMRESSVSVRIDSVDMVAEEKDLDEAVTGVTHVAEKEVNLDGTWTTYEMKSSTTNPGTSVDLVDKVAVEMDLDKLVEVPHKVKEKDFDEGAIKFETESSVNMAGIIAWDMEVRQVAEEEIGLYGIAKRDDVGGAESNVGDVALEEKDSHEVIGDGLHVATAEVNLGETTTQNERVVIEDGVESTKDDEMVNAIETTIDTHDAGLDDVCNMVLKINQTDRNDDESDKVDRSLDDDMALEMEKGESETVEVVLHVKEEFNRMGYKDVRMKSGIERLDMTVATNDIVDSMKEIEELSDEFDGHDMLEKTAEVENRNAGLEASEQEIVEGMEMAEAKEDADGSCMLEGAMKGGDAEVEYEDDDIEEEADVTDLMEEAADAEEAERIEESEKQIMSNVIGKRKRDYKGPGRPLSKKKIEEDVCFICFDGGELVLCDRRFNRSFTIFYIFACIIFGSLSF